MKKKLSPKDLAEITTGLLVDPASLGELEEAGTYRAFVEAIASTVADFCGGEVSVEGADGEPVIEVTPNENLPSLHENVWALYDLAAFLAERPEDYGLEAEGRVPTPFEAQAARGHLQTLLLPKGVDDGFKLTREMVDWAVAEDQRPAAPGDDIPYEADIYIGNQSSFLLQRGDFAFTLSFDIDNGVPTVHLSHLFHEQTEPGDALLHLRATPDGVVCTHEGFMREIPGNRYTVNADRGWLIEKPSS